MENIIFYDVIICYIIEMTSLLYKWMDEHFKVIHNFMPPVNNKNDK
jgi:hypothetical protein